MSRAACCAAAEMVLVFAVGMSRAACCAASEMVLLLATLLAATATYCLLHCLLLLCILLAVRMYLVCGTACCCLLCKFQSDLLPLATCFGRS